MVPPVGQRHALPHAVSPPSGRRTAGSAGAGRAYNAVPRALEEAC